METTKKLDTKTEKTLREEFKKLGALAQEYIDKQVECCKQWDYENADVYNKKAQECLKRRDEILKILYGYETGIAV